MERFNAQAHLTNRIETRRLELVALKLGVEMIIAINKELGRMRESTRFIHADCQCLLVVFIIFIPDKGNHGSAVNRCPLNHGCLMWSPNVN